MVADMILCKLKVKREKCILSYDPYYSLVELCPNCARQGQMFPNNSKRNQKLVEKVV
jgi:hypothetical protein